MTLDKDDKKEIADIIQDALAKSPILLKVDKKLDATMEMCAKNTEEITLLRDDFTEMGYTVERIETKLDASIRRQDDASVKTNQLNRRVLKLETKKSH